ncbi:fimbrial protein [Acinetobacter sp. S40]|uniref:fimbrial protein n=1 Tax=Acinetobacter sp. S40 TaxID=2767434 RepID=UPI00190A9A97|nr:fimbrial protein [Acinetobacter sp. S40]MBJ9983887.1 fimbrial protein [Acinetobacter sp. S40]
MISTWGHADVLVNVTAQMLTPACNIAMGTGKGSNIEFGRVQVEDLKKNQGPTQDFRIDITGCDFGNKAVGLAMLPKVGSVVEYNSQSLLATTTDGLAIAFKDKVGGKSLRPDGSAQSINLTKYTDISLSTTRFATLNAQLINTKPADELELGPFEAVITLLAQYL